MHAFGLEETNFYREAEKQGTNNNHLKECLYAIKYYNNIFGLSSNFGYLLTLQSTKFRERIKSHRWYVYSI